MNIIPLSDHRIDVNHREDWVGPMNVMEGY